ncbi:peptidase inhibitor family I36 protein [Streptomyces sp. NPDC126514]|uniref:peptidase inhibitor family I36 protein n=1 Tax=Streptomyces sp. NPDC126514 TaxID=3155210 RepID=UPI00331FCDB2
MPVIRKALATAAVLASTVIIAHPASAHPLAPSSPDSSAGPARQEAALWHAYMSTGFTGGNAYLYGNTGECTFVGHTWNDRVASARTESSARVELWDHANCTGGSIVIDRTGYGSIGPWVSAYRVTYP